ncbi:MaoC family dehydratase [Enterovirga aerilata]|uniref:MaoC family dehydratase n=1 Tax=Enterovirga aerilata TaxID=2730920 RepID=A0A849I9G6_9HYPH|nr:MaoC family dehydratase [Enterovirga sp. DB1703]NNM74464.1 MaoC family dehydratase [Enterovirga sp. DB1703]
MPEIYFEDLVPGTVTTFGGKSVSAGEIIAFARAYDAQPFHLGEDSARDTFVGRLIASGWHTIAMQMRMLCDAWLLRAASMGSPGIDEVQWLRPVLPGDLLSVRQTILEAKTSRSRPAMGVVQFRFETLNGAGEVVMSQTNPIMFERRSPGEPMARGRNDDARPEKPAEVFDALRPPSHGGSQMARGFDALEIGATDFLGEHTFEPEEIVAFAGQFDPQPFHLSEEEARKSHFGRLAASGWHTAAIWMRLLVKARQAALEEAHSAGREPPRFGPSPGFKNLRWLKPVYAGDTIRFATTLVGKRISSSRPGWGISFSHNTGWNQEGEKVFAFDGSGFIGRNVPAETAGSARQGEDLARLAHAAEPMVAEADSRPPAGSGEIG